MRRPSAEASHQPPFLEDIVRNAQPLVDTLGAISVRELASATQAQLEALTGLWEVLRRLTTLDDATCVGISKATMLLTSGRIGPAFDRLARQNLRISKPPSNATSWIACLRLVNRDINEFEAKHQVILDHLLPDVTRPVGVGRVYDMMVGPREKTLTQY